MDLDQVAGYTMEIHAVEKAHSVESDGTIGNAIYSIHKLDDNNFTWSSTGRFLNDSPLPDTEEIKVSRMSSPLLSK